MNNYENLDKEDEDFCYACDGVIMYAEQEFKRFWDMLDLNKPKACKEALLLYVPLLASECAEMGAFLSREYLDTMQLNQFRRPEYADYYLDFDIEKFTKSIDYFCRELFNKW